MSALFFEFSDSYLFIIKDGIIKDVNGKFLNHFGYDKTAIIGVEISSLILTKDLKEFDKGFQSLNKTTAQVLSKDKRASRVEWEFQEQEGSFLVKGNDITEKLKHEQRFEQYSVLFLATTVQKECRRVKSMHKTAEQKFNRIKLKYLTSQRAVG